jgi:hypothetical protein
MMVTATIFAMMPCRGMCLVFVSSLSWHCLGIIAVSCRCRCLAISFVCAEGSYTLLSSARKCMECGHRCMFPNITRQTKTRQNKTKPIKTRRDKSSQDTSRALFEHLNSFQIRERTQDTYNSHRSQIRIAALYNGQWVKEQGKFGMVRLRVLTKEV